MGLVAFGFGVFLMVMGWGDTVLQVWDWIVVLRSGFGLVVYGCYACLVLRRVGGLCGWN